MMVNDYASAVTCSNVISMQLWFTYFYMFAEPAFPPVAHLHWFMQAVGLHFFFKPRICQYPFQMLKLDEEAVAQHANTLPITMLTKATDAK